MNKKQESGKIMKRILFCLAALWYSAFVLFAQEETAAQPVQPVQPVQPAPVEPVQAAPEPPAFSVPPAQPSVQPPAQSRPSQAVLQPVQPQQPAAQPTQPAVSQPPVVQPAQPAAPLRTSPDALQNYRIGRDLEARNRFGEANSYYNEAVRICLDELNRNGSNMEAYTVLTWSLLRQRKYAEVINWGDRALRINPNDFRIVETLGEAYFFINDYAHSLIMMQCYVANMPRQDRASTAYFFMGEIYRNQRKYLHADIAYTTAVTLEGSMFLWWFRLGTVREAAGEYTPAIEAYEKTLDLNPNYQEAVEALERTKRLNAAAQRNQG
ncbi:MAG: tetratricopeptide repeat protein [Treponema sp.]|jgi:tetratricopeptide (TPR) repeat protein|nr:tetratricopeptide repeat protein [Treponema sp.]